MLFRLSHLSFIFLSLFSGAQWCLGILVNHLGCGWTRGAYGLPRSQQVGNLSLLRVPTWRLACLHQIVPPHPWEKNLNPPLPMDDPGWPFALSVLFVLFFRLSPLLSWLSNLTVDSWRFTTEMESGLYRTSSCFAAEPQRGYSARDSKQTDSRHWALLPCALVTVSFSPLGESRTGPDQVRLLLFSPHPPGCNAYSSKVAGYRSPA